MITPVADQLHPSPQLTDGDCGQKERGVVAGAATQKLCTPGSAQRPLRASLITLVSIKNISGRRWLVLALEISVHTDIRHGRQQVRQVAPHRAQHGSVIDTPHQQVSHGVTQRR